MSQRDNVRLSNYPRALVLSNCFLYTEESGQRWLLEDYKNPRQAIITNVVDGTVVTIIGDKKTLVFGKRISDDLVDDRLLLYIAENIFRGNGTRMINWLKTVKPEKFDMTRIMFAFSAD